MQEAELLFADNVRYNSALAARNGKHHHINIGRLGEAKVTSEEVLKKLRDKGIDISIMTLTRYDKNRLLPIPKMQNQGRKGGRAKDWPDETPAQGFAAYKMLNGQADDSGWKLGVKGVAKARVDVLKAIEENNLDAVLPLESVVWLRLISEFHEENAKHQEVEFFNKWGMHTAAPFIAWCEAETERLNNMTPEERVQDRAQACARSREELRQWREKNREKESGLNMK